jgi:hypothetical protein
MNLIALYTLISNERIFPRYLITVKKIYYKQISAEYNVPELYNYNEKFFWSTYRDRNLVYGILREENPSDYITDDFES